MEHRPPDRSSRASAPSTEEIAAARARFVARKYDEAEREARRLIERYPGHPSGWRIRGVALAALGRLEEAVASLRESARLFDADPQTHYYLGVALQRLGRLPEAEASYRATIASKPDYFEAYNNLGSVLRGLGRFAEAEACYRRTVELNPRSAAALNNLGNALKELDRPAEAEARYREALALVPGLAEAHHNLGIALHDLGRLEEAVESQRRAIALKPDYADAYNDLGNALKDLGRFAEAGDNYRQALALQPDFPAPRFGLGLVHLFKRDWTEGWSGYEYRWSGSSGRDARRFTGLSGVPPWRGEPLAGRSILVFAEQGLGDQIMFARFLDRLAAAKRIVALVPQPLVRLFANNLIDRPPQLAVVSDPQHASGSLDGQIPLASLPHRLGMTDDAIAAKSPYLVADARAADAWRKRLASDKRLRVGIVWRGRPVIAIDRWRSIALAEWGPLLERTDVRWVSLQKPEGGLTGEEHQLLARWRVDDWTDELTDLADTAAIAAALDLVISVDTAVAHLAGALDRPVWLLNRATSEWRWGWRETRALWYPRMRIFNQAELGRWGPTLVEVAAALESVLAGTATDRKPP